MSRKSEGSSHLLGAAAASQAEVAILNQKRGELHHRFLGWLDDQVKKAQSETTVTEPKLWTEDQIKIAKKFLMNRIDHLPESQVDKWLAHLSNPTQKTAREELAQFFFLLHFYASCPDPEIRERLFNNVSNQMEVEHVSDVVLPRAQEESQVEKNLAVLMGVLEERFALIQDEINNKRKSINGLVELRRANETIQALEKQKGAISAIKTQLQQNKDSLSSELTREFQLLFNQIESYGEKFEMLRDCIPIIFSYNQDASLIVPVLRKLMLAQVDEKRIQAILVSQSEEKLRVRLDHLNSVLYLLESKPKLICMLSEKLQGGSRADSLFANLQHLSSCIIWLLNNETLDNETYLNEENFRALLLLPKSLHAISVILELNLDLSLVSEEDRKTQLIAKLGCSEKISTIILLLKSVNFDFKQQGVIEFLKIIENIVSSNHIGIYGIERKGGLLVDIFRLLKQAEFDFTQPNVLVFLNRVADFENLNYLANGFRKLTDAGFSFINKVDRWCFEEIMRNPRMTDVVDALCELKKIKFPQSRFDICRFSQSLIGSSNEILKSLGRFINVDEKEEAHIQKAKEARETAQAVSTLFGHFINPDAQFFLMKIVATNFRYGLQCAIESIACQKFDFNNQYDRWACEEILKSSQAQLLGYAFSDLKRAGFNCRNVDDRWCYEQAAKHSEPRSLVKGFLALKNAGLDHGNPIHHWFFEQVAKHSDPIFLGYVFWVLKDTGFDFKSPSVTDFLKQVVSDGSVDMVFAMLQKVNLDFKQFSALSFLRAIMQSENAEGSGRKSDDSMLVMLSRYLQNFLTQTQQDHFSLGGLFVNFNGKIKELSDMLVHIKSLMGDISKAFGLFSDREKGKVAHCGVVNAELAAGKLLLCLNQFPVGIVKSDVMHANYRIALKKWYCDTVSATTGFGPEAIERLYILFSAAKNDQDLRTGVGKLKSLAGNKSNSYQTVMDTIKNQIKLILAKWKTSLEEKVMPSNIQTAHVEKIRQMLNDEVGRGPHLYNLLSGGTTSYREAKATLDQLDSLLRLRNEPR